MRRVIRPRFELIFCVKLQSTKEKERERELNLLAGNFVSKNKPAKSY